MSTPEPGSIVVYRSFVGEQWSAELVRVHPGGDFVDLEVIVPGTAARVPLTGVRWSDGPGRCAGWPEKGI